jgi:uncharacterized protein YdaU (DUF1376 family)
MGSLKWYKRDPRAALTGMMGLTLEERGAYTTVLDLIYCHDGELIDNPREICNWLNCNIRTWKRIRARLMDLGKLYVHAGCLRNERADHEVSYGQSLAKLSLEKARKRWATHNEIKRLSDAGAMLSTTTKKVSLSANIVPIPKKDTRER